MHQVLSEGTLVPYFYTKVDTSLPIKTNQPRSTISTGGNESSHVCKNQLQHEPGKTVRILAASSEAARQGGPRTDLSFSAFFGSVRGSQRQQGQERHLGSAASWPCLGSTLTCTATAV